MTGKKVAFMFLFLFIIIIAAAAVITAAWLTGTEEKAVFAAEAGLLAAALAGAFVIFRYITVKILAPVRRITAEADKVTLFDSENEVGDYTYADGEIGAMTRSIHKMTEKLRSEAARTEKTCAEVTVKRRIDGIMSSSSDMKEVFESLAVMFCEYFNIFKTTVVYLYEGHHSAFSHIVPGFGGQSGTHFFAFPCFEQVDELLRNRNIAFLNKYSTETQGIEFLDNKTESVCIIPLRNKELFGFVIFEDIGGSIKLSENTENMMIFVSETLCCYFFEKDWGTQYDNAVGSPKPDTEEETVTDRLRKLEFLDVDAALAAVGGLRDIYEQSVKVTVRLLPETVRKMDAYIEEGDIKKFGIEAHGMKSVLRNIGAATLGSMAAWLENAAKSDEIDYCHENYPPFKELLLKFEGEANVAIAEKTVSKGEIDKDAFRAAMESALEAAQSYDAVAALETVRPLSGYAYDKDTDDCLKKIIFALEEFNCQNAIKEMEVILNGGT